MTLRIKCAKIFVYVNELKKVIKEVMKKKVLFSVIGVLLSLGAILIGTFLLKHEHVEVIDNAVLPTCDTVGFSEGKHCADCGEILIPQSTIPALGHVEVTDEAIQPTCTAEGKTEGKHCYVCNKIIIAQQTISKLPHTEVEDLAIDATCMSSGLSAGKHCSVCSTVLVSQEELPMLEHTLLDDAAIEPTCTSTGLTVGKHCSVCETVIVEQEEVPMIDHVFDGEYDRFCNVCDYERQINCRHDIPEKIETIPSVLPTCEEAGLTAGKYCSVCDQVIISQKAIPAMGHTEVIDPEMSPTCEAIGRTEGTHCSICGKILIAQIAIKALGHIETVDVAIEPTCATEGKTEGKHCLVCNKTLVAQASIEKLPHTEVEDEAIAATCTSIGLTAGKHCSVCETVIVKQEKLDMLKHVYDDSNDDFCNLCGYMRETNCLHDIPERIEKIPGVAPTCESTGLTEGRRCTVCGVMVVPQIVLEMIECVESEWIIDREPTHAENGVKHTECTMCGKIMQEEILPAGNTKMEFNLLENGTYECGGIGSCTETDIVIPSVYNGISVTGIAKDAFYNCTSLTSIKFPASIISIGENAFYGCISIADVYYEGDINTWCRINFENAYSNPMFSAYCHNNSQAYYPELSSLDFILKTGDVLLSDSEAGEFIDEVTKDALWTLVNVNLLMNNSYTSTEMHIFLSEKLILSDSISLFQIEQLYGLYLFNQVENQGVNFITMLDFMINIADTDDGKRFIDEETKANLVELYNALNDFIEGVEKEVTKEEFFALVQDKMGSGLGNLANMFFDGYNKEYNGGANESIRLIDLLKYVAYENSLSSMLFSMVKDLKESLNNIFAVYDDIQKDCHYNEFLPLIDKIIVAFKEEKREINATDKDVQQVYIMYFYANERVPDTRINGKDFILFVDKVLDENSSVSKVISDNEMLKIEDVIKVNGFLSDEEKYSCEKMYLSLEELLTNIPNLIPSASVSFDAVRGIYYNHLKDNIPSRDEINLIGIANLYFDGKLADRIVIPESISNIDEFTFAGCAGIKEIVISSTVTSISACAFKDCIFATINCELESKPDTWNYFWNYSDCPVVWGYTG